MARVISEDATPLPLFPLANVVLFPHSRVPLHIFEPRYLQMTEAALEGERCIGMVTVRPEALEDIGANPPVFPVGCSGVIEQIAKRAGGRYDLVLHGTHRFRIVEEIPIASDRIYRLANVEVLTDRFDPRLGQVELQNRRIEIVEVLETLVRRADPRGRGRFDPRRLSGIDDEAFVNVMCQIIDGGAAEKQGLLDADDLLERSRRLLAVLRFRVAETGGAPGTGSIQ